MTIRFITRAGVCAAVCLTAAGAVVAGADPTPAEPSELAAANASPISAVQFAQAQRFGELRRPRAGGDSMPQQWEQALSDERKSGSLWGANPGLSRHVAPGVWLIPGNGFICVAQMSAADGSLGFGCATPLQAEEGLLQPAELDNAGNGIVTGVLPDGVASVTLIDRDGTRREAPVERNVYRAAVDAQVDEVRWSDSNGIERSRSLAWTP
ncbi:MAG: hypothetical protein QOJ12_2752 [Thermoleophilales bacterium]|nr:hypothetical protein [Thermoleophilales bacterium]